MPCVLEANSHARSRMVAMTISAVYKKKNDKYRNKVDVRLSYGGWEELSVSFYLAQRFPPSITGDRSVATQ